MRADLLGRLLLRSLVGCQSTALIGRPPPLRSVGVGHKRTGTTPMAEAARIAGLKAVGRYALGVDWADRHDSIFPYRALRRGAAHGRGPRRAQHLPRLGRRPRDGAHAGGAAGPLPLRALRGRARLPALRRLRPVAEVKDALEVGEQPDADLEHARVVIAARVEGTPGRVGSAEDEPARAARRMHRDDRARVREAERVRLPATKA